MALSPQPPPAITLSAIAEETGSDLRSSRGATDEQQQKQQRRRRRGTRRQPTLHVDMLGDAPAEKGQQAAWKRALAALLWKNWLLLWKRRNKYATALELLLPVACAALLGVLRLSASAVVTPTTGWGDFVTDASAAAVLNAANTPDYNKVIVAQESSVAGLLLHLSSKAARDAGRAGLRQLNNATLDCVNALLQDGRVVAAQNASPATPPPLYAFAGECRGLAVPYRIAIVPDNSFTRDYFTGAVSRWYPRTPLRVQALQGSSLWNRTLRDQRLLVPSFEDSVTFFSSEAALEAHVRAADYGSSATQPKIYAALVFHQHPQRARFGNSSADVGAVKYSIRMNANAGDTVSTSKPEVWDPTLRPQPDRVSYTTYATDGFLTLQSLVTRFLVCKPQWNETRRSTDGTCMNQWAPSAGSGSTSPALENQFLRALGDDVLINDALANFDWIGTYPLQAPPTGSVPASKNSFAKFVFNQSERVNSILLRPFRQLPPPHLNGRYLPMVTESASVRSFYPDLEKYVALLLAASYIYAAAKMISTFIGERETHAREFLQVFGIRERFVWISWYITYGTLLLIGCTLVTMVFQIFGVFSGCSAVVLFLLLCLFAWSLLSGAFLLSTIFSSARLGAYIGAFLILAIITLHERLLLNSPRGSYYVSQLVLAKAMKVLMTAEQTRVGSIGLGSLNKEVAGERLSFCLGALLLHCVFYTVAGLYLERVLPRSEVQPGTSGERVFRSREVWYFPVLPSFWKGRPVPKASSGKLTAGIPAVLPGAARSDSGIELVLCRTESPDLAMLSSSGSSWLESFMRSRSSGDSLRIQHNQPLQAVDTANAVCLFRVSVSIPTGDSFKEVLDSINLALPVGKITSIVGASSAGKTALLSTLQMRTPLIAGDVGFEELSWKANVRKIRKMMGFCFQSDVLFPELTVLDHLQFYAKFRVFPKPTTRDEEILLRLNEFNLFHQRSVKAKCLSVASRRKLTLAIALLRDERSKFLFLDEPTHGMDPYTRKQTWGILRKQIEDRVVVVSTSDIIEATTVGDQVAILADRKLQYAGSPSHLEASSRAGYLLTLEKSAGFREREVMDLIWSSLKTDTTVVVNSETTFVVRIPIQHSSFSSFAVLFQQLETQSARVLGVKSHQLSLVRLEDAFGTASSALTRYASDGGELSPARSADTRLEERESEMASQSSDDERLSASLDIRPQQEDWLVRSEKKNSARVWCQAKALVRKRLLVAARSWSGVLLVVLCPAIFLVVCMAIVGSLERTFDEPAFSLNPRRLAEELGSDRHVNLGYSCLNSATGVVRESDVCRRVFNASRWQETTPITLNWTLSSSEAPADPRLGANGDYTLNFDSSIVVRSNRTSSALDDNSMARRFNEVLFNRRFYDESPNGTNHFGGYLVYTDVADRVLRFDLFVNTSVPHASGIFRAQFDDSILRVLTNDPTATLEVLNHPLPQTAQGRRVAIATQQGVTVNAFLVVLVLTYFPATVVERLVGQRSRSASDSKYSDFLAGTHVAVYWTSNYFVDLLIQLLSCACVLIVIAACDISTWTGTMESVEGLAAGSSENPLHAVIVLLVTFAFASCSAAYMIAFFFRSNRKWFLATRVKAGLLFASTSLTTFVVAGEVVREHPAAQEALATLLGFSPFFSLCYGLHRLAYAQISASKRATLYLMSPFHAEVAGVSILFLGVTAALFFAGVITMENLMTYPEVRWVVSRIPKEERATVDTDEDGEHLAASGSDPAVVEEFVRVRSQLGQDRSTGDSVLVHQVSRIFRDKAQGSSVYSPVSFGVARGECFAILGVEGSGKSSVLKIISGEVMPSTGQVFIDGVDAVQHHTKVRQSQRIGYCAQGSCALQPRLTVREQLLYRARQKSMGTDSRSYAAIVDQAMDAMELQGSRNRLVSALDRVEKRKVCIAMALLGLPSVVVLDEPTAGLDAASRELVWKLLSRLRGTHKCAIVIATKSLDECVAVSTRVGILHEGTLSFVGSYEALRSQFEYGWILDVRFGDSTDQAASLIASSLFSNASEAEAPVTRENLKTVCEKLGHAEWADRVHAKHPTGSWIDILMEHDGLVSARTFQEWWVYETNFETLEATLGEVFGSENTRVLRRHANACRFQLVLEDSEVRLSQVFKVLENARARNVLDEFVTAPSTFHEVMTTFAESAAAKRQLRHANEARVLG